MCAVPGKLSISMALLHRGVNVCKAAQYQLSGVPLGGASFKQVCGVVEALCVNSIMIFAKLRQIRRVQDWMHLTVALLWKASCSSKWSHSHGG